MVELGLDEVNLVGEDETLDQAHAAQFPCDAGRVSQNGGEALGEDEDAALANELDPVEVRLVREDGIRESCYAFHAFEKSLLRGVW